MRGGKSGGTLRVRKPRADKNILVETDSTTRVLRSLKRKLNELKGSCDINVHEKKSEEPISGDTSDCIILSDSEVSPSSLDDVNKPVTSTPNRELSQKSPNFDQSCIKSLQNTQPGNASNDVIVISDSSGTTLPVIVLSDEDQSDVEVIHLAKKKKKEVLSDVIDNENTNTFTKRNVPNAESEKFSNTSKFRRKKKKSDRRCKARYWLQKHRANTCVPYNFGENIYVENPVILPQRGLRPIIIDGSNVAFHHSNNSYFSCKGLEICIKYFKIRGHEVIAFVPHYRVKYNESDNPKLLDQLVKSGDVVLTPSRMVNGSMIVSYDDRFIVQTAVIKGGVIVTRDNYRDLLDENPLWAETIKYRLLQFTWVQDLLMFPKDPLGRSGPSLEEFLRFG